MIQPRSLSTSLVVVILLQLAICHAAPRKPLNTYDQRQDGNLNVHAKLENFLIVIAPVSSAGSSELAGLLQNGLLTQALELKNVESGITADNHSNEENEDSRKSILEPVNSETLNEDISKRRVSSSGESSELQTTITRITRRRLDSEDEPSEKHLENAESSEDNLKKKRENEGLEPSVIDLESKSEKQSSRIARSLNDRLSVSKLPPYENDGSTQLENKLPRPNKSGNEVPTSEQGESEELRLLGGGIENCGPERFRDRFGICRFRVDV